MNYQQITQRAMWLVLFVLGVLTSVFGQAGTVPANVPNPPAGKQVIVVRAPTTGYLTKWTQTLSTGVWTSNTLDSKFNVKNLRVSSDGMYVAYAGYSTITGKDGMKVVNLLNSTIVYSKNFPTGYVYWGGQFSWSNDSSRVFIPLRKKAPDGTPFGPGTEDNLWQWTISSDSLTQVTTFGQNGMLEYNGDWANQTAYDSVIGNMDSPKVGTEDGQRTLWQGDKVFQSSEYYFARKPQLSPGGGYLLFTSWIGSTASYVVEVVDLNTGARKSYPDLANASWVDGDTFVAEDPNTAYTTQDLVFQDL